MNNINVFPNDFLMARSKLLRLLIAATAIFLSALSIAVPSAQAAEARAGVILAFTGKVEITHGTEKHSPVNHADLFSGDTISTEAGQVQIRFADGTLLTLYSNTKFSVDDYRYANGNGDRAQFSLVNGVMHTLTGQIDKKSYLLKARLANLGVRGTEYSVQLTDTLHVSVDQGQVQLANAGGVMLVGPGQSILVMGANAMPQPVIGGKIDLGMNGGHGHGGHGGRGGPGHGGISGAPGAMGGMGGGAGGAQGGAAPPPPPSGSQKVGR
jgi:ferric-dicitrate binding protein FerR (iron transport regulator)